VSLKPILLLVVQRLKRAGSIGIVSHVLWAATTTKEYAGSIAQLEGTMTVCLLLPADDDNDSSKDCIASIPH